MPFDDIESHSLVGLEALEPGARDVVRRLLANGASALVIQLALQRIKKRGAVGIHAIDAAAEALGRLVRFLPSPRRPERGELPVAFAFCGPSGAGKSSVMLRLGLRMQESGRRVICGAIALPDQSAPAARELGLALPFLEIEDGAEVERAIRKHKPDALLIDTPGLSPRDPRPLAALGAELRSLVPGEGCQLILCLPATMGRQEMRTALRSFRAMGPAGVCLTRLDEAKQTIPCFEELVRARLPLAFLAAGRKNAAFWRPSVDRVANLILRGRLAATPSHT